MSAFRWRTASEGFVEVDQGNGFARLELAGPDAATERISQEWFPLVARLAAPLEVPVSWVLGVMYAESAGRPDVSNECCVGLMAINTGVFREHTRAEWFDPETNVQKGAALLASSRADGWDLPSAASIYNAGPGQAGAPKQSSSSPWGMVENVGYIERVVRASNFFRSRLGEDDRAQGRRRRRGRGGAGKVIVALGVLWALTRK